MLAWFRRREWDWNLVALLAVWLVVAGVLLVLAVS